MEGGAGGTISPLASSLSLLSPATGEENFPGAFSFSHFPSRLFIAPPFFGLLARMSHRIYLSWRAGLSSSFYSSLSLQDGVSASRHEAVEEHRHGVFLGQIR